VHAETPDGRLMPYGDAEVRVSLESDGNHHLMLIGKSLPWRESLFAGTQAKAEKAFNNLSKKIQDKRFAKLSDIMKGV